MTQTETPPTPDPPPPFSATVQYTCPGCGFVATATINADTVVPQLVCTIDNEVMNSVTE